MSAGDEHGSPAPPPGGEVSAEECFTAAETAAVADLNRVLHRAYADESADAVVAEAQRLYLSLKARVAARTGRFGIVNNRIFSCDGNLMVPYLAGDTVTIQRAEATGSKTLLLWRFPAGTIITDELLLDMADCRGRVVDLESDIFDLDPEQVVEIRVGRLRDMGELLARINRLNNRNEAVYALRFLVAQLCSPSFRGFLGTKNLQPEVRNLVGELKRFVNTPIARRVPLLVRILVRNVSGIVVKPGLIDSLWSDAIEVNETLVRGSDIATELRRSTHHALGDRTLRMARSYLHYLDSGDTDPLARLGYPEPAAADEAARSDPAVRVVVARMVKDLDRLLGTSEVLAQLRDWQDEFSGALYGCKNGKSLDQEVAVAIEEGIRARNRWVFYHHLRALKRKADDVSSPLGLGDEFRARMDALLRLRPDEDGFDAAAAAEELREAADRFRARLESAHRDDVFGAVERALEAYARGEFHETAAIIHRLRRDLAGRIERGGFYALRYHLFQLDCLLEKMSYLALRHIATGYEERGVHLRRCLEIIVDAISNLAHDGLYSREVADLAGMLTDGNKTYGELANVMETLQRNYHKSLQRITAPYQMMQARLGLGDVELRIALANMQRYMHDHNTMVNFCDLARSFIRAHVAHGSMRLSRRPVPRPDSEEAFRFLHLSDRERVRALVESNEGGPNLREHYGGKGSGLIYLSYLGIPTRDGFILPTTLPQMGLQNRAQPQLRDALELHLRRLESDTAARGGVHRLFGDPDRPLLLAVRGGSVFSMPGILSTVVFLGLNDTITERLAADDPWHAWDSYRRFLASFAQAIWDVDLERHGLVPQAKQHFGVRFKNDLPWEAMRDIAQTSLTILGDLGHAAELARLLNDPFEQLVAAVRAVLNSWNRPRAQQYREIKGICHTWQTAATVQQMASGNFRNENVAAGMDERRASLTGVIPRTEMTDRGVRTFTGEIKFSAAGDDLVGGITSSKSFRTIDELRSLMPMLHRRLKHIVAKIMRFMGSDQEIEFTVERGVLSVLQARAAELGADLGGTPFLDPGEPVTHGLGIRGGGFRGLVAFDESDRRAMAAAARRRDDVDGVLIVMENPTPDDIPLILSGDGLLTAKGGNTTHAAVSIHGIDEKSYCAVMSAAGLRVSVGEKHGVIHDAEGGEVARIARGDVVSIHGTEGDVYLGTRRLVKEE